MVINLRGSTDNKFVNREVLIFDEPALFDPVVDPCRKVLSALQELVKLPGVNGPLKSKKWDRSGTNLADKEKWVKPVKPNLLILLLELNGIEPSTS